MHTPLWTPTTSSARHCPQETERFSRASLVAVRLAKVRVTVRLAEAIIQAVKKHSATNTGNNWYDYHSYQTTGASPGSLNQPMSLPAPS
jgi:hypothetical protein